MVRVFGILYNWYTLIRFYHRQQAGSGIGNVNSSSNSLQKLNTRAKTIAKLCERKDSLYGKDSILRYSHTPSVARDMITIIDAWDELSESVKADEQTEVAKRESQENDADDEGEGPDTKGKLVYWGFSYGVRHALAPFQLILNSSVDSSWCDICIDVSGSSRTTYPRVSPSK